MQSDLTEVDEVAEDLESTPKALVLSGEKGLAMKEIAESIEMIQVITLLFDIGEETL